MISSQTSVNQFVPIPTTSPTTLLGYLKALGLMAITDAKGYWEQEQFYLNVESIDKVVNSFISDYEPKPIANPWNKKSGFLSGNQLKPFLETETERYQRIRETYQEIIEVLSELNLKGKGSKELKPLLFPKLEESIEDDAFTDWLSSVGVVTTDKGKERVYLNDLLGTGGNVSTSDLAFNYLECCRQLWDIKTGEPTADCQTFAEVAIAATPHPKSLIKKGILCHLSPRADFFGELDTRTGTDDYPANGISTQLANPVDYILAIEGLLQFSGTVKNLKETDGESAESTYALYPLLLEINAGSAETSDRTENNKHECWLPLWSEPIPLKTYRRYLNNHLNYRLKNQIRDTLDLLAQLSQSSQYLEFTRYSRFGFWPRKGQGSYAIHIGIESPDGNDLGAELRCWRKSVLPRPDQTNATYNLLMSLEQRLTALQRGQGSYQELLILLGSVEKHLSKLQSYRMPPVPTLSEKWVQAAYEENDSSEFRLAAALASTRLRSRISNARYNPNKQKFFWSKNTDLVPTYSLAALSYALLRKWSQDLDHHPSQFSKYLVSAKFEDIEKLMQGTINETLILDLACGLSLCEIPTQLWEEDKPNFLPFSYRYAAYAHWHKDYSLPMKEIYGLQQGSTVPLVRRLRAQGINNVSLPPTINNGTESAIALAFPINPYQLGMKNQ
ncbi:MAG: type I-U CRISPR-associated protein Csx17 [Halothece sp. Uz-M2-17]|nr:type I-U CRISPR-associated protein Csx17 [Halothece sp. Uz-M2-17]